MRFNLYYYNFHNYVTFESLIQTRRNEAKRSILIQVADLQSASDLHEVCSEYGSIHNMFLYQLPSSDAPKNMILVEFTDQKSVDDVILNSQCVNADNIVPVHSSVLWLAAKKGSFRNKSKIAFHMQLDNCSGEPPLVKMEEPCEKSLIPELTACIDVELALSGLFPKANVLPFGSSVNSFGRCNSDLDMLLEIRHFNNVDSSKRLFFHVKQFKLNSSPRIAMQRQLEVISDVLDDFVPGCSQVWKILGARIPIIKFKQTFTGIECDLSMTNLSGFYMSEMLYVYGSLDKRVCPLVFAVRRWAKECHLTSPTPGRWITNFSLTLMVLFYLMNTHRPVLPSLQVLSNMAEIGDERMFESVRCSLLRDIKKVPHTDNIDSLEELLLGFYVYYNKFDFKKDALSLVTGQCYNKPEYSPLFIQNPLQRELNVSRNVTYEEIDKLKGELSFALYTLMEEKDKKARLGILSLWSSTLCSHSLLVAKSAAMSINWKDVFQVGGDGANAPILPSMKTKVKKIDFSKMTMRANYNNELNGLVSDIKKKVANKRDKQKRTKRLKTYRW